MGITLTESAASRVRHFMEERGGGIGLRLGVTRTGCSGYAYVVDFADELGKTDQVFESNGVKVVVDADTLPLVDGTEIDFGSDGFGESFKFHNPKVKSECGCGESFGV